jgi:hypothetical protein
MKTNYLISKVAVGNLAGAGVAFIACTAFPWYFLRQLGECCWAVLAFPLGWVGLLVSKQSPNRGIALLCFWGAVIINGYLWGWTVSRITRAVQRQKTTPQNAFDASAISARILQLRHDHAVAAYSRSHHLPSRKGLVAAARRALTRFAYFSGVGGEHSDPAEHEAPKNEP